MADGMTAADADAFLGPDQVPNQPVFGAADADKFLGPAPGASVPASTPERDSFLTRTPVGRVLDHFKQGAADGWGTSDLGFTPEAEEGLRKAGIFSDVAKGQGGLVRAFNEAMLRPAAAVLDAAARLPSALISGAESAVQQAGTEAVSEDFGRQAAGLLDFGAMDLPGVAKLGVHAPASVNLGEARSLGVIGSRRQCSRARPSRCRRRRRRCAPACRRRSRRLPRRRQSRPRR